MIRRTYVFHVPVVVRAETEAAVKLALREVREDLGYGVASAGEGGWYQAETKRTTKVVRRRAR